MPIESINKSSSLANFTLLEGVRNSASIIASPGGGGGGGDARNPSYTPFYARKYSGTIGSTPTGNGFTYSDPGLVYSNAIAGPFGDSTVLRLRADAGTVEFGGTMLNPPPVNLIQGDEFFFRKYVYFPEAFCAGYGSNPDGWGVIKWIRLQWATGGSTSRATFQLSGFSNNACALPGNSPRIWGFTFEGVGGGTSNQAFENDLAIPRDQWGALQFSYLLHPTNGRLRAWLGTEFVGEIGPINTMPGNMGDGFVRMTMGDWWNGYAYQTVDWYVDEIIATKELPNTFDSGGRPFIHPDTRIADFA